MWGQYVPHTRGNHHAKESSAIIETGKEERLGRNQTNGDTLAVVSSKREETRHGRVEWERIRSSERI
jgi:hypothetical protein